MTQVQQKQETAQTFSCSGCGGRPVWDPEWEIEVPLLRTLYGRDGG